MYNEKIIYSILTEISKGNRLFKYHDYEISKEEFINIFNFAVRGKYIDPNSILYADNEPNYDCAEITTRGVEFIQKNNNWAKFYRGLKEVKDWIK